MSNAASERGTEAPWLKPLTSDEHRNPYGALGSLKYQLHVAQREAAEAKAQVERLRAGVTDAIGKLESFNDVCPDQAIEEVLSDLDSLRWSAQ